ncbi:hypothetical protein, partial [Muribaculum intestinale]|uniref:hypothetical protein n=1 Tax=Muribaculum intestinale TaxID=1796646 RepID=UPI003F736F85
KEHIIVLITTVDLPLNSRIGYRGLSLEIHSPFRFISFEGSISASFSMGALSTVLWSPLSECVQELNSKIDEAKLTHI